MRKIWMIFGCAALLIAGCGNSTADQHYKNGVKSLENEDFDTAAAEFNQVIAGEERLPEAYRALGIAYLEKESYPESIAAFSRSLNNLDESDEKFEKDVMYYLAQARLAYGETDKAIAVYTDILKKGEDAQAFFLRGRTYINNSDYENAKKDFTRALKDCTDYNFYINIYQIYADKNKTVDGSEYLNMALEMEPQTGEDYYHRGRIYEYQKDLASAKDSLIESLQMGYEDAMLLLGRVYLEMEDSASARSMYQEYLSEGTSGAKAYNGLALCDIYEGSYDDALANIQKGLAENDSQENQGLLYNEIVAYEYKKDFATAKDKMNTYLEQYPEDKEALRENEFLSTR
jgi:tetratricopeptide (TPR) repeat protein